MARRPTMSRNGFQNYGNTCWLNSVLQALFSIPVFQRRLEMIEYTFDDDDEDTPQNTILNHIKNVYDCSTDNHHGNQSLYAFVNYIFQNAVMFEKYQQCDAHDFYVYLTDTIHEESGMRMKNCVHMTNKKLDKNSLYYKAWKHRKRTVEKKYSLVSHHFQGVLLSSTACNCAHESNKYESFSTLQLSLPPQTRDVVTIDELLDEYTSLEMIDDFKCEKCNEYGGMSKDIAVAVAPEVLVIQLKRFETIQLPNGTFTSSKNNTRVAFPHVMSLENALIPEEERRGSHRKNMYRLQAIVHHTGSIHAGHYFAQIRDGVDGPWYLCNDSIVTHFPLAAQHSDGIPASSPYMAFYVSCRASSSSSSGEEGQDIVT